MKLRNFIFLFLLLLSNLTYAQIVSSPISSTVSSPVKNPVGIEEEETTSETPEVDTWTPDDLDNLAVWYPATVDTTSNWGTPEYQLTNEGTGPDAQLTTGGGIEFNSGDAEYVDTGTPINATSSYEMLFFFDVSGVGTSSHFIDARDAANDGVYVRGFSGNRLLFQHNSSFNIPSTDMGSYTDIYLYIKWDGATSTVSMYEPDGTLIETNTASISGAISTTTSALIGANSYSLGNYYTGDVSLAIVRTDNSTFDLLDVISLPNIADNIIQELHDVDFYYRFDDDTYTDLDPVTDISKNGNDGVFNTSDAGDSKIYTKYAYQPAIVRDGKLDFNNGLNGGAVVGDIGNVRTVSFMIRVPDASTDQTLFDLGTPNNITITSSSIACSDFASIVVDGSGNTITDNVWHHVYMQSTSNVDIDNLTIPSGIDCMMVPPIMYSDTLTAEEKQRLTEFLEEKSTTDVFVFWFQSNADGQGQIEDLSGSDSIYVGPLRGIEILSSKTSNLFELAQAGVNMRTAAGTAADFGPDLSAVKDIYNVVDKPVKIVKQAVAGTSIGSGFYWNVASSNQGYDVLFYDGDGSSYLEKADVLLGGKMKIRGVFGIGGESDATGPNANFETDLEAIISQVRTDWGDDQIKFFFNKLHADYVNQANVGFIRTAYQNVADNDDLVYLINVDDIELKSDSTHYDSHELIEMGQRFAVSYLEASSTEVNYPILSNPTASASGLNNGTGTVTTDTGAGTLYWVLTDNSTAPISSQIINGNDETGNTAIKSGSQAVTSAGVQNISFNGLYTGTFYVHYVQSNSATSTVVSTTGTSIGSSLNPYTSAYLAKCLNEGHTQASGDYLTVMNDFMQDLDDADIIDVMDIWFMFVGNGDTNSKRINWADTSIYGQFSGGPTIDNLGVKGNGTNSYFITNYAPFDDGVNYTQNNASMITDVVTAATSSFKNIFGTNTVNPFELENASSTTHYINSTSSLSTAIDLSGTGLLVLDRQSSSAVKGYQNSTTAQSATQTANSLGGTGKIMWGLRLGGQYVDAKISFMGAGASVDSLISELKAARDTFITALNGI